MLVLGAKVHSWGRFARRWWWLGLPPAILILVLGVNERRRNQGLESAVRAMHEDRLKDSQKLIEQFLKTWPDHAAGHLVAARLDRLLGNYAGAENHLNECKRLGGMTGDLQVEWLLLRAMNGEYALVEKDLHELLAKDDPRSDLIVETLIHCHNGVLRYNSAMAYLQNWLKKDPDNIRALDLRAYVWERLENPEQAKEDYKRVLTLAPANRHARLSLVELLLGSEKNIDAAAEHLKILKENPQNQPGELMAYARFELLQGNLDEARGYLDELLAKTPEHVEALFERGMLAKDPVQAEGYFRKALKGNPSYLQARYQLYTNLFGQGRTKEAEAEKTTYLAFRQDSERLLKLLPEADRSGNPDLLAEVGAILMRGGDPQGTQLVYRALHINPNHKKSHELLADHFEKTKQPDKADYHRRRASQKSP
jgi:tetratricopeptide (TPR) repeat protein